jgi:hypothetical protein
VRGLRERRAARAHHLAELRRAAARVNASSTAATRGRTKITATRGHERELTLTPEVADHPSGGAVRLRYRRGLSQRGRRGARTCLPAGPPSAPTAVTS